MIIINKTVQKDPPRGKKIVIIFFIMCHSMYDLHKVNGYGMARGFPPVLAGTIAYEIAYEIAYALLWAGRKMWNIVPSLFIRKIIIRKIPDWRKRYSRRPLRCRYMTISFYGNFSARKVCSPGHYIVSQRTQMVKLNFSRYLHLFVGKQR